MEITIFNGWIHYKWQFSIAMLVYQRVYYTLNGYLKVESTFCVTTTTCPLLQYSFAAQDQAYASFGRKAGNRPEVDRKLYTFI